jgi:hypothetical protein
MLNNTITPVAKLFLIVVLTFLLLACFDIGKNNGTNEVLLNGSVLKGVVSQGQLSLVNETLDVIWQGISDDEGKFQSSFLPSEGHLFTLVVQSVLDGFIECDATQCEVPTTPPKVYSFGDLIPGSEVGDVTLRSAFYLGNESGGERERIIHRQINGFSSLVINLVDGELEQVESRDDFVALTQSGSRVLLSSLGLADDLDTNFLALTLPDVTQVSVVVTDPLISTLALLNASMSANLSFLAHFSDALIRYSSSMDDELIQQELKGFQQELMTEAIALIASGQVNVSGDEVLQILQMAKDEGINFDELNEQVDNYFVATGEFPSEFTASSTSWDANNFKELGQWWWVSEFNRNEEEWLQLDYVNPFIATQVELGLSNGYPITDTKIQGSNDGIAWHDLADVNALPDTSSAVQPVQHINLSLSSGNTYRYYRFLAKPIDAIWLEYFCIYEAGSATDVPCEGSKAPINAKASSYKFSAKNINNSEMGTWWVSELASGKDEWVQVGYQQAFLASQILLVVKQESQGVLPEILGSNDGLNWDFIVSISADTYPNEVVDSDGFRHLDLELDLNMSYRYFRYVSKPSAFVLLSMLRVK